MTTVCCIHSTKFQYSPMNLNGNSLKTELGNNFLNLATSVEFANVRLHQKPTLTLAPDDTQGTMIVHQSIHPTCYKETCFILGFSLNLKDSHCRTLSGHMHSLSAECELFDYLCITVLLCILMRFWFYAVQGTLGQYCRRAAADKAAYAYEGLRVLVLWWAWLCYCRWCIGCVLSTQLETGCASGAARIVQSNLKLKAGFLNTQSLPRRLTDTVLRVDIWQISSQVWRGCRISTLWNK